MERLKYEHLLAMLQTQDTLNAGNEPSWRANGHNHMRDAWCWAASLSGELSSLPKMDKNPDAFAFIDDIWNCLLNEWLVNIPEGDTIEDAAALFIDMMYTPEKWTPEQEATLQKHTDVLTLIDAFANLATAQVFNAKIFERIMELLNYSWAQLYERYAADFIDEGAAP